MIEELGYVPTACYVLGARSVTTLAGDSSAAMLQGQLAVRIAGEALGNLIVAGGAGLSAHEVRRSGFLGLSGGRFGVRRGLGLLSTQGSGAEDACAQHQHQTGSQPRPLARNRTNRQLHYRPISIH